VPEETVTAKRILCACWVNCSGLVAVSWIIRRIPDLQKPATLILKSTLLATFFTYLLTYLLWTNSRKTELLNTTKVVVVVGVVGGE